MLAAQKYPIDIETVVIEDGEPVDSILSEKLMRFLTHSLYTSWQPKGEDKRFMINANVGIFSELLEKPIVPDVMLSLKVEIPKDWQNKKNRSYFLDKFGKPPEIAIEIVSNKKGHERDGKLRDYAIIGVEYYVIYDPLLVYQKAELECYKLERFGYELQDSCMFVDVGLGLKIWEGEFENVSGKWLRWCDQNGKLILTGKELAEEERHQAEIERLKAKMEQKKRLEAQKQVEIEQKGRLEAQKREQEAQKQMEIEQKEKLEAQKRAEFLAKKLKELGVDI